MSFQPGVGLKDAVSRRVVRVLINRVGADALPGGRKPEVHNSDLGNGDWAHFGLTHPFSRSSARRRKKREAALEVRGLNHCISIRGIMHLSMKYPACFYFRHNS